ncbi:hypothetical protein ACD591_03380 [Rufibacter glacialis]|uniref:Uncharacterized protein n=1 Tax=Rufibacter glacialis TaxID=1259555 RepID=A0A5M8QHG2_9BACT|nr:hypothetical protein [Rufibacter glacialis]KAA6434414.1 hypothetical protein FOE74_09455 [Rufibacter glacialis]GGK69354.1 hypothetical protein GCM10011405_16820 [Rufibacter glacialis]
MKFLFMLGIGGAIGWATAFFDVEGQMALEQHQEKIEKTISYQAAAKEVEEATPAAFLFRWP